MLAVISAQRPTLPSTERILPPIVSESSSPKSPPEEIPAASDKFVNSN